MNFRLAFTVIFFAFYLSACGSWMKRSTASESAEKVNIQHEVAEEQIKNQMDEIQSEYGRVELVVNKQVLKWINYYKGRGRSHMRRYLERSTRYVGVMREVLREEGLPEDLVYLPIIESGYSSSAHSFASAVGYWQFIRSTGKRYGLNINTYVDERRDPIESTRAAGKFLKALYNLFGDWYLALAAYNTGENRVKRAVMKYGTRDFWALAKRRRLHRETRNYVPKFLAALIIAKNPRHYGFRNLDYKDKFAYESIPVFRPISLEKLANNTGHSFAELRNLNPKFRTDYVPVPENSSVYIRVPKGEAQKSVSVLAASYSEVPSYIPKDYFYYRVHHGDTLSGIAYKNRTTISTLRRMNRLHRRSFIRVGQRLRVPDRGLHALRVQRRRRIASRNRVHTSGNYHRRGTFHTVRRGENLSVIARRYGISVAQIRRLNRLGRRSLIRAGQKLKIKKKNAESSASPSSSQDSSRRQYHIVEKGENLSVIAQKHGCSVAQLKRWNDLGRRALIRRGQKIHLRRPSKKLIHIVRRGENLSVIASRYRVSVGAIARVNDLKSASRIVAGRELVIPR